MEKRKLGKWFFLPAAGIVLFGVLLSGKMLRERQRAQRSTEPVKLSFYLRKRETTHIFEAIVEKFNQSQDEIQIHTVTVPNPDVDLKMRALNGEFPDIVEMIASSGESVRQYAQGGYLAALDDTGLLDRLMEGYEPYLTVNGAVYMIPLSVNFRGLFVNCDLLEEAGYEVPRSYEELHALLEKIKIRGEQAMVFPDKDVWTLHQGWDAVYTVAWGSRKEAYRMAADGTQKMCENESLAKSLELYLELRKFGQERSWETGYDEAVSVFAGGEAWMFLQGNWAYSAIKKQNPDIRLVFIPFPTFSGDKPQVFVKLDSILAVSSSCEHPEAAQTFLEYLLSEEVMKDYTEKTGAYSCIKGGNGDLSFAQEFIERLEKNEFVLEMMAVPDSVYEVRDQGLFRLILGQDDNYGIKEFLYELDEAIGLRNEEILDEVKGEQTQGKRF